MYIPKSFAETDQQKLHEFIGAHSFATLVSQSAAGPCASHLPLLLDAEAGSHGMLIGHMARANPQWEQADGQSVLAIFHGPHAYISPTWYEAVNVVPTWNYVAVHVYGTLRLQIDRGRLLDIVRQSVEYYENELPQSWSMDTAEPDFIDGLLDAIVGFEIDIDRIEGKWKLNQHHDETRRRKVIEGLRETGGEDQRQIAELMSQTLVD
ncbi:MAG: FMN-binding negative transcriptional regulator [Planctomycetaceae bacterium]|jgi:transcriptional regulator|nr:FMN-binding negative transcriptional regulator [Planctomycetaceae bacterium]MBT6153277.1 FMN-binding negative transcriptional regulator [Planctomycetaceae bacterium]MBT6486934.1 FMN-binding negative transcriptional regulator [Planctomycetaceae bacterium]MBT6493618.1 FMN-binding negative transcriptional regulator [Planctomycetaceae bacterium]